MSALLAKMNIEDIIEIAHQAGEQILEVYRKHFAIEYKKNRSPLTQADKSSHQLILERLKKITPNIPVISEESNLVPYEERKEWNNFWLVDPLDGTKEFIKRNGEFTVNIALIEDRAPTLGVVYAPELGITYYAKKEQGAFKRDKEGAQERISAEKSAADGLKVVASRSHRSQELESFLAQLEPHKCVSMGSSLKFCLVAEGSAHLYPRLVPTMEWDTAAGQCVVEEAGAVVKDVNDHPLQYNKEKLVNPYFIVNSLQ